MVGEKSRPLGELRAPLGGAEIDAQAARLAPWNRPLMPASDPGPLTVLVVQPSLSDALFITTVISATVFGVTVARDYYEASAIIKTRPPRVLITELRLAEYNGLQLVLRAKAAAPDVAALVTTRTPDPVLASEAERMGATFVVMPTSSAEFLAATQRTAFSIPFEQPIRPPFERRFHERRVQLSPAQQGLDRRSGDRRRNGTARGSRFALIT